MDELFLHLLNVSITAGWLVLLVTVLRMVLKKAPRVYHCVLWAVVGLRLIWPFSIESILSLIPSTQTLAPEQLYSPAPQIQSGVPAVDQVINPIFSQIFAPNVADSVNPLQVVLHIAGYVWLLGVAGMLLYSAISYWRLRRQVRAAVRQEGNVYLCDTVASPFILGVIRPRIYLPSDMPPAQTECVLAHERAHLKRRDHWWKPLGYVLLAVYWFHPLLWLAYILLCRDIEFACDEKVIRDMDLEQKAAYSETLLECSIHHKRIAACPLAFGETGVKSRIRSVLNYKKPAFWLIVVALIACIVVTVGFLTEPEGPVPEALYVNAAQSSTFPKKMSAEDAAVILSLLENGQWADDLSFHRTSCVFSGAWEELCYDADVGVFHRNGLSFTLSDADRKIVNGIITKYTTLAVSPASTTPGVMVPGPTTPSIDEPAEDQTDMPLEQLQESYPVYFGVETFKGIEIYVWDDGNIPRCVLITGTNRNKTLEELNALPKLTVDQMRLILTTYDCPVAVLLMEDWFEGYWEKVLEYRRQLGLSEKV